MNKNILVVGAVGIAILVGVALVGVLLFGSRAAPNAPAGAAPEPARLEAPATPAQRSSLAAPRP